MRLFRIKLTLAKIKRTYIVLVLIQNVRKKQKNKHQLKKKVARYKQMLTKQIVNAFF